MGISVVEPEGLRERKKRVMRETIAAAAMTLFQVHGFDAVTVADVARAADVSTKTIFNYFPTKEDLVFHSDERRAALVAAIRERPAGDSLVAPFRRRTLAFMDRVETEAVESILLVPRLVAGSEALRNRLVLGWEQEAAVLAPVIAAEAGSPADDLVAAVVARTLAWTHRLAFRSAFHRLLDGEDREVVAADVRAQAMRAYDVLEAGLAGYAVKVAAT